MGIGILKYRCIRRLDIISSAKYSAISANLIPLQRTRCLTPPIGLHGHSLKINSDRLKLSSYPPFSLRTCLLFGLRDAIVVCRSSHF
jgi:hypothetical protein